MAARACSARLAAVALPKRSAPLGALEEGSRGDWIAAASLLHMSLPSCSSERYAVPRVLHVASLLLDAVLSSSRLRVLSVSPRLAAAKVTWPIHREAPAFVDQGTAQEILTTGIKVREGAYRRDACMALGRAAVRAPMTRALHHVACCACRASSLGRWWTCWHPTRRVARLACSVARAWARPC